MSVKTSHSQTGRSVEGNVSFFRDQMSSYRQKIEHLETYARIRACINEAIAGAGRLVDIGNGGVCDYDTTLVREITAIDLFFDEMPPGYIKPANVKLKKGSALEVPEPDRSFDCAVLAMLIHHLVGKDVEECIQNIKRAIREAYRVLRPGGLLVVSESCVAPWFYGFERLVFPLASPVIARVTGHPATIQYPSQMLRQEIEDIFQAPVEVKEITRGAWILQYGYQFPSVLTPARPFQFCVRRPQMTVR